MGGSARAWRLGELELRIADLTLRPLVEAELDELGSIVPDDLEFDPSIPRPFGLPGPQARAVAIRQEYWRRLGRWSPQDWALPFAVRRDGHLLGTQILEGSQFTARRTVGSASWLATGVRGTGVGKLMRTAVLALAFDGLGAEVAETEAWADNAASLGVSRALGYLSNGTSRHVVAATGAAADMPRLRLTLADWCNVPRPPVRITGLDGCRAWFGV